MSKPFKLREYLDEQVDLPTLIDALEFTDETVASAAELQPKLFLEAGRFRVQKMRKKNQAEAAHALLLSEKALKTREKFKNDGEKVTEANIKEKLGRDRELLDAAKLCSSSEESEEYARLLVEAYRQRSSSLKVVADLMNSEARVRSLDSGPEIKKLKEKLKSKYKGIR